MHSMDQAVINIRFVFAMETSVHLFCLQRHNYIIIAKDIVLYNRASSPQSVL